MDSAAQPVNDPTSAAANSSAPPPVKGSSNPTTPNANLNLGKRVTAGVAYTLLGAGLGKTLGGITSILLARLLGASSFGQYGIIQSTVLMFSAYGALRMGAIAVKYVAQHRQDDAPKAARILRMALWISAAACATVSFLVYAFAPQLAARTLGSADLADSLRIGALFLGFTTFGSIVQQALGGFEDFKATSSNGILRGALGLVITVPLAWQWGLHGALWGMALASLLSIPQAFLFLRRQERRHHFPRRVTLKEAFSEYPVLYQFALPSFLMLIVMTGANWLGRVLLLRAQGFAEVGLFEAAGQWVQVVSFAPTVLSRVVLPILSSYSSDTHSSRYQRTLSLQLQTVLLLAGPATVLMIALSHWVRFVYGSEYAGTERILPVLLLVAFLRTVTETFRISYESMGRQWSGFFVYVAWSVVLLGASLALAKPYGAMGFALANLAGQIVLLGVSAWQVHYRLVPGFLRADGGLLLLMTGAIAAACVIWALFPVAIASPVCLVLLLATLVPLFLRLREVSRNHPPKDLLRKVLQRLPWFRRTKAD